MEECVVLLLGRSLLLSGVAASLGECAGLRVASAATWGEAGALLAQGPPDVLIADLAAASASQVLPLLFANPGLVVIGLDAERNRAMLVSGREAQALTMQEIRGIVERRPGDRTRPNGVEAL